MPETEVDLTVERTGHAHVPAVSVCVPLYNKETFVGRTIASLLAQTFTDFELVVLENASTDGSLEMVRGFDDPRIVLVRSSSTVPMIENYNRIVGLARAPLIKVINADDQLEPTALERQVAVLESDPDVAMVTCRQSIIDENDEVFARGHCLRTPDLIGRQDRATVVRRVVRHGSNPIGNPGNVLFRRAAFDACGGFRAHPFVGDVGLWVELVRHGHYYGIPEDLAVFRCAPMSHSTSTRAANIVAQRRFIHSVMRTHRDVVRSRDRILSVLRIPVTVLGSQVFFSASTGAGGLPHRLATRVMAARNRPAAHHPA